MWIMVSGPYRTGAATDKLRADNLAALNRIALELFRRGHAPIVGVNLALPMVEPAGVGKYDEVMMPLCLRLCERCDAILRIGGKSFGADEEVRRFIAADKPVYETLDEVPPAIPG